LRESEREIARERAGKREEVDEEEVEVEEKEQQQIITQRNNRSVFHDSGSGMAAYDAR